MKNLFIAVISLTALSILFNACSSSTEPNTSGSINLSSKYSTTDLQMVGSAAATGVLINKVTYILREIKFKNQKDSTDGLFKTTPLVLELNIAGSVQEIGGLTVPFGTYNRLEFDIHRAEANDTTAMNTEQRAKIRQFFVGDKYSFIIEGVVVDGATQKNFVYKSKMNMKQKIDLIQPLVVTESDNIIYATMLVSSFGWFKDGNNILDPTNPINESKIDYNIRQSIKAIKDKNKDGIAD